jgi:hypothetical protein
VAGLLLLVTLVVNMLARWLVWRVRGGSAPIGLPAVGVPLQGAR